MRQSLRLEIVVRRTAAMWHPLLVACLLYSQGKEEELFSKSLWMELDWKQMDAQGAGSYRIRQEKSSAIRPLCTEVRL